eukprot:TRINITY_DN1278_c0_g1_i2.p1 TRINITY_DN1278_c0_g1~~TRINITY_DN1278_c0_g1_i2.p1  ORF type:complete len:294 (+),score=37.36 TRINITY_DN1278_c0_g1_i2:741-1622(+)
MILLWATSTFLIYKSQSVIIHKAALCLLVMRFLIDLANLLRISTCSPTSVPTLTTLIEAASKSVFQTFSSPFIYILALGTYVTSNSLPRKQVLAMVGVSFYCYLVFSSHYILGMENVLVKTVTRILIIALYIYMAFIVFNLSIGNIKILHGQQRSIAEQDLTEIQRELEKKMRIYFAFGVLIDLCYIGGILEHMYLLVANLKDVELHWIEGIESLVYWFAYLIIVFLFNPCFFTANFRMTQIVPSEVKCGVIVGAGKETTRCTRDWPLGHDYPELRNGQGGARGIRCIAATKC